jgi:hypothetical protein
MDAEENGIANGSNTDVANVTDNDLVDKARVTELIKREKEAAYRKAQREFQAQMDAQKTGQTQNMGGMQQPVDREAIKQELIEHFQAEYEKAQKESQQAEYENFVRGQVDSYVGKLSNAPSIADDFKEMTAKFKPDKFREVFYLANSFENAPAIIYELQKNPSKLANIDYLAKIDPDLAKEQIELISKSMAANMDAKDNHQQAPSPLGRTQPSLAAKADNGKMSLQDFKKADWLRG